MSTALGIIAAILAFGFLIVTHEGGHYLAARAFDVKVNEFAVGMGPKIFSKEGKETTFSLRLIPFGGFCAMEGESEDSEDPRSFGSKTPGQRAVIILAGAAINLFTGLVLVAIMLSCSDLIGTPYIRQFADNSTTQAQGLEEMDRVYAINGHKILSSYDLSYYMMTDKDGVMDITVKRDGTYQTLESVKFPMQKMEDGKNYVGIDFSIRGVKPTVGSVLKYTVLDSISFARMVWEGLIGLLTAQYDISDMAGPVGTVSLLADTTKTAVKNTDYSGLLFLMALLAINIGVFNLIPFPALDGGRFWFIAFEGITGKKPPERVEAVFNGIGLALLMGLMIMVTFSDISKFF